MPFDFAHRTPPKSRAASDRLLVAGWLFAVCAMVFVMVVLGGATRLTGSGLSIMEWAPLSGVVPPWSEAEWQRLFTLYQHIPQYRLVNDGFGLDGFKHIFWLEWTHRLWGRLTGTVLLVPLVVFGIRGSISRALWLRLAALFVLGGLQGAVGWFMVASGFAADSTAVSAYRLVVHLTLALLLYSAILWTALGVWHPARAVPSGNRLFQRMLLCCALLVPLTIVAGGFVAGLHAGLVYNSFPTMGDSLVPAEYGSLHPWLRNLTENVAAVQFDHRALATLTAVTVLATTCIGLWQPALRRSVRRAVSALGALVIMQYVLGVSTLLSVVQAGLATAHQAVAVLLLSAVLVAMHLERKAG